MKQLDVRDGEQTLSAQRQALVQSFLDQQFRSIASLGDVSTMMSAEQRAQSAHGTRLASLRGAAKARSTAALDTAKSTTHAVADLQAARAKLGQHLEQLAQSAQRGGLLANIAQRVQRLDSLHNAAKYLEIVKRVNELREDIRRETDGRDGSIDGALRHVRTLREQQQEVSDLAATSSSGDAKWSQLELFVQDSIAAATAEMTLILDARFNACLDDINWPEPTLDSSPASLVAIGRLKKVASDIIRLESTCDVPVSEDFSRAGRHPVLRPIDLLVERIRVKLRYHFGGDRPTNRLDKPEWLLSAVLKHVSALVPFIDSVLQPVVDECDAYSQVDARHMFINCLCDYIATKINSETAPMLVETGNVRLVAHWLRELAAFEQTLADEYLFDGIDDDSLRNADSANQPKCTRLGTHLLSNGSVLAAWIASECDAQLETLRATGSSETAWDILYADVLAMDEPKPTRIVERINTQLDILMETAQLIALPAHQVRFISGAVFPLLGEFGRMLSAELLVHDRSGLLDGLVPAGLLSVASVAGSAVARGAARAQSMMRLPSSATPAPSTDSVQQRQRQLSVNDVIKRISALVQSTMFLRDAVDAWDNNPVFVELSFGLDDSADLRTMISEQMPSFVAPGGSLASSMGSIDDEGSGDSNLSQSLFGPIIRQLDCVADHATQILSHRLAAELKTTLRPYLKIASWSAAAALQQRTVDDDPANGDEEDTVADLLSQTEALRQHEDWAVVSPELVRPLSLISQRLQHLSSVALPRTVLLAFSQVAESIDEHLFHDLVMSRRFSRRGAHQLSVDMESGFWQVLPPAAGVGSRNSSGYYPRMREACILLNLPETASDTTDAQPVSLSMLYEFAFDPACSTHDATAILAKLGIDALDLDAAEKVTERRVSSTDNSAFV